MTQGRAPNPFPPQLHLATPANWTKRIEQKLGALGLALAIALAMGIMAIPLVQAQTFTVLHTFTGSPDGEYPFAGLVDISGNLLGTTSNGGKYGFGSVFDVNSSTGSEKTLYSIDSTTDYAPLGSVLYSKGTLYVTTSRASGDVLAIKGGKATVLYSFTGSPNGASPYSGLLADSAGNLYGTTLNGGTSSGSCLLGSCGVVYKLDAAGTESVLWSFAGEPDGANPYYGTLVLDSSGNLYGTTAEGGANNEGTVFEVSPTTTGGWTEKVLHSFSAFTDGSTPYGGLIRDAKGNLYGTASANGPSGVGTVFKLSSTGTFTVLHSFTGGTDGSRPEGTLVRDTKGNLYGTTYMGGGIGCTGSEGCGTVFEVTATGDETILHAFNGTTDGAYPIGGLAIDKSGNLYGTASDIQNVLTPPLGTVFKLVP